MTEIMPVLRDLNITVLPAGGIRRSLLVLFRIFFAVSAFAFANDEACGCAL